jgi:hypothetical protein
LRFVAYPSHQAGAQAFLKTLMNSINRPAFEAMKRDDFNAWFGEVRDHYAAPPPGHQGLTEQHRTNYRYLVDKFRGTARAPRVSAPRSVEGGGGFLVLALLAGTAWLFFHSSGRPSRARSFRI